MHGLRPEHDRAFAAKLSGEHSHGKSYQFANRLTGRFFVSGISGSFQKHRKMLDAANVSASAKKDLLSQYQDAPFIDKQRKEQLRKEAEKLLEMEEKIKEVKSAFNVTYPKSITHVSIITSTVTTKKRAKESPRKAEENEKALLHVRCLYSASVSCIRTVQAESLC